MLGVAGGGGVQWSWRALNKTPVYTTLTTDGSRQGVVMEGGERRLVQQDRATAHEGNC